jgi:putative membrane protein
MTKGSSTSNTTNIKQRNYNPLIWTITILAIITILGLNYIPRNTTGTIFGMDLAVLPLINAILNGISFIFLVCALVMIKKKNIKAHQRFIYAAFATTFLFLITYLTYHAMAGSTKFGATGVAASIYYIVLISHVILAAAILPLSLMTLARGLNMRVEKHRKIARWTMPIWLYVSITGVVVYLMISPYY